MAMGNPSETGFLYELDCETKLWEMESYFFKVPDKKRRRLTWQS